MAAPYPRHIEIWWVGVHYRGHQGPALLCTPQNLADLTQILQYLHELVPDCHELDTKRKPSSGIWYYIIMTDMPSKPKDQHCCMHLKISQISSAAIQILQYLHEPLPNWDEFTAKRKPSSDTIESYHYHVCAIQTQGSLLMHGTQNFVDTRGCKTKPLNISMRPLPIGTNLTTK